MLTRPATVLRVQYRLCLIESPLGPEEARREAMIANQLLLF